MNFDPAGPALGRQLARSIPQIKPGQKANDKIIVLEDTDGDGKADKTTVFADGLLIPTGVEPGDGGAYVANSTELLHLERHRRRRQGRPDAASSSPASAPRTRTTSCTRSAGARTGMLYFNQSIYIHSHIETPHGVRRLNGGGIWQFRPETMRARGLRPRAGQPLGPPLRPLGPVVRHRRRRRRGDQLRPARRLLRHGRRCARGSCTGLNPGSPKYCGLEIVSGRHLPDDWQGNLHHQRLPRPPRLPLRAQRRRRRLRLAARGRADQDQPRRVPADRREDGPRRRDLHRRLVQPDHPARRGRFPRPAPRPRRTAASGASPPRAGRSSTRPQARRRDGRRSCSTRSRRPRTGRGSTPSACSRSAARKDVLPALAAWVAALDADDAEHEHHLLEALWTYQSLDVVEPKLLADAAATRRDPASGRRRCACVAHWHDRLPDPLGAAGAARRATTIRRCGSRRCGRWRQVPQPRVGRDGPAGARPAGGPVPRLRPVADGPRAGTALAAGAAGGQARLRRQRAAPGLRPAGGRLARRGAAAGRAGPGRQGAGRARGRRADAASPRWAGPTSWRWSSTGVVGGKHAGRAAGEPARRAGRRRPAAERQAGRRPARRRPAARSGQRRRARRRGPRRPGSGSSSRCGRSCSSWLAARRRPAALRQAAVDGLALLGGTASREALERAGRRRQPLADAAAQAVVALAALDLDGRRRTRRADVLADGPAGADPTDVFAAFLRAARTAPPRWRRRWPGKKLPADVAKVGVRDRAHRPAATAPALVEALTKAGELGTRAANADAPTR